MRKVVINVDERRIEANLDEMLKQMLREQLRIQYSATSEQISIAVKKLICENKDMIIENVVDKASQEIVRCKDCKYYNEDCMSPHSGWCECLERGEYENHFCSYGERKEGADNG